MRNVSVSRRVWVGVSALAALVVVGASLFLVFGRTSGWGPTFGSDLSKGDGPVWTNERTGATGGPDYDSKHIPFERSQGCGAEDYTSSLSYRNGWYVQSWTGPRNMVTGRYLASTTLPDDTAFTGWSRPDERLWFSAQDRTRPGEFRFLYVQRGDHVERWPRATFGCA